MKILLLGYSDYLSSIIFNLKDTPFFDENNVDIMFASPNDISKIKNIKKVIHRLKKLSILKIITKLIVIYNYKSYSKILDLLFKNVDLSFVENCSNLKIINYPGLEFINNMEEYDFMIVASFGQKIPTEVIKKPKRKTLNIHPSYLPELRGGYPTYVEAFKGSIYSGTTIHYMEEKWDNGDIVIQKRYKTDSKMNNNERYQLSAKYAATLLNELHKAKYRIIPEKQSKENVTYCHKIIKPKAELQKIEKNEDIQGIIRANYAKHIFPFTYTYYNLRLFSIIEIRNISENRGILSKYMDNDICKIFRHKDDFFLNYYGKCFVIEKYIYKRQIYMNY